MVSATREIICLTLVSRRGVPSGPRKYLLTTTLVAICDQKDGTSQSRCSNTVSPFSLLIDAVRFSQVTSSKGCTPSRVNRRSTVSPPPATAVELRRPACPARRPERRLTVARDGTAADSSGVDGTEGSTLFPLVGRLALVSAVTCAEACA